MDDQDSRSDDHVPDPEQPPEEEMPWSGYDLEPQVGADDESGELLPPPGVGGHEELIPAPEPARRRPRRGATVAACLVVVLAVLGVMAMALSVKLYLEQRATVRTLQESVQSMALLSVKLGAPERIQGRLGWLSKAIERGDWQQAQRAAEALRAEEVPAGAGATGFGDALGGAGADGQLPDPMKVEELEPEVRLFFAQNSDAWRAFLGFTQAAIRMRDAGLNVDDLRTLRGQMVEAARLGQKERLSDLLARARQAIERKTGPEAGQAFEERLRQFAQAFARAQEQRRDVAPAGRLAAQAERAARQGDMGRAVELIEQATTALQDARRLPGGRPPMRVGMPQMGPGGPSLPELSFLQFLAGTLNNVMQAERMDLAHVWTQLRTAVDAIREKNQDQIREMLGEALDVMDLINVRRTDMSRHIQQTQQRMMQGAPQAEQPRGPSREEVVRELQARIGAVLADARRMTDEQFEANRQRLAEALIEVLMPGPAGPRPGDGADLTPEQRVRAKMQMVAQPYAELKRREVDTTELDQRLSQAREAIMAHDYEKAEELVDGSIPLINELLEQSAPPPGEGEDDAGANPPAADGTGSPSTGDQTR